MAFTIPDKGEALNDIQSRLFQEDIDVLVAGFLGTDCVLSGCAVTAQGTPDMTVAVAKGAVCSNGALFAVAAGNATITAAHATLPRIDLVVVDSAGAKQVRAGTAASAPKPPARTANDVVLAQVYVPAANTAVESNQITDRRVLRGGSSSGGGASLVIKKATAAVIHNTTAAEQTYASISLPSGLFTTGQILRVRCGGNMLLNSGTPTVRLVITFGGTTMFSDISGASSNDTDRLPWHLDLDLIAVSNTSQKLNGDVSIGPIAAKTAPTTGEGDAWSTASNMNPIRGTSAVDADAADRVFDVRFTMSVSNASNEIVCDYATFELL